MAWPVASTGIDSHAELVKRAKRCIRKFEVKLAEDAFDNGAEQSERNDIIRGAFEIAARELTSDRGTFLNTSYRSGQTDSFRAGTAALSKRMADRFANKLLGRGTNQIFMQDELERNRKRKQNQMAATTPDVKTDPPAEQSEKKLEDVSEYPRLTRSCRHPRDKGRCRHCWDLSDPLRGWKAE